MTRFNFYWVPFWVLFYLSDTRIDVRIDGEIPLIDPKHAKLGDYVLPNRKISAYYTLATYSNKNQISYLKARESFLDKETRPLLWRVLFFIYQ